VATSNKSTEPAIAETLSEPLSEDIEAQRKEYGTYIANRPIDVNGARAYNVGDPVPVSNVQQHGYDKMPTGEGSKTESWVDKV
jgi:hypothetical protein